MSKKYFSEDMLFPNGLGKKYFKDNYFRHVLNKERDSHFCKWVAGRISSIEEHRIAANLFFYQEMINYQNIINFCMESLWEKLKSC